MIDGPSLESIDVEIVSFATFVVCYSLVYFVGSAKSENRLISKTIREKYRASFVDSLLLHKGDMGPIQQLLMNNITITGATITGVVIMAGVLFDHMITIETGLDILRSSAMIFLLGHILISLLSQIRTMMYIPVVFGANAQLIKTTQGMLKHDYVTKLFSNSYRLFSNAMKDVFFLFSLFIWSMSTHLFMIVLFVITFLIITEETEKKAKITIF